MLRADCSIFQHVDFPIVWEYDGYSDKRHVIVRNNIVQLREFI